MQGNRTGSTYPTGVTWNRAFDASNRPTTTKDSSGNTLVTNTYDILDRMTETTLANGTTVTNSYDLLNRLTNVDNALGGTVARNYSYIYDDASRVVSSTEPRGTISYAYSNRDEVTGVTEPSGSPFSDQSFDYDAAYNRSNWTLGSTSTSYTANNLDEYTAIGAAAPGWNSDGGLSSYAGYTYSYDALMRLTEVDYSGGKTLFGYDPLGRRVQKVDLNSSGTVLATYQYHYDGSEVAVEYRPSSVTWTYCGTLLAGGWQRQQAVVLSGWPRQRFGGGGQLGGCSGSLRVYPAGCVSDHRRQRYGAERHGHRQRHPLRQHALRCGDEQLLR